VHLFDPHVKYMPPEPYDVIFEKEPQLIEFLAQRKVPEAYVTLTNRYDGEILYTDGQVGRLLAELHDLGLWEDVTIVLAADHGEGIGQHGVREHGELWNEQLFVPLIIRIPDGPRGRSRSLASLIDILPTLAEEIDLPLDRALLNGINLFQARRETALSQRTMGRKRHEPNLTLIGEEWKYAYFADHEDRLHHLPDDPHELENLISQHPEQARRMRHTIEQLIQADQARSPLEGADLPEEIRRHIRALGYFE
jgi:arylsulfatase A-like enzyme